MKASAASIQLRVANRILAPGSRQVRVALTGAHSTGKSTLLARCKEEFGSRLDPIENIARSLIARGFKMGISANSAGLLGFLSAQLGAEHRVRANAELVISDRTCIDSLAYCRANRMFGIRNGVPLYVQRALEAVALRESSFYDLHVYFPIEFEAAPDPVRPPAGEYRQTVDRLIREFLEENHISCHVATGSRERRFTSFLCALQGLGMLL
jgi:nicotinamide riboside kinase